MQPVVRLLLSLAACCVLLSQLGIAAAFNTDRQKRDLSDSQLTIAVLTELIHNLEGDSHSAPSKRRFDGGYGSRYGVAQSVGSKLMALKQAADWNGPGRKRREVAEDM